MLPGVCPALARSGGGFAAELIVVAVALLNGAAAAPPEVAAVAELPDASLFLRSRFSLLDLAKALLSF